MVQFICSCSRNKESKKQSTDVNNEIQDFLSNKKSLDHLWSTFDSNADDIIDEKEFDNMLYKSLIFFISERKPDLATPSREKMIPFIKKLHTEIMPFVDKDKNKTITKEEFRSYGKYLTTQFEKLQKELTAENPKQKDKGVEGYEDKAQENNLNKEKKGH